MCATAKRQLFFFVNHDTLTRMMTEIEQRIVEVLETIRPRLAIHFGDVSYVDFDPATGCVRVQFQGTCVGCPLSEMTLKMGIESVLKDAIPEVQTVVAVPYETSVETP